MPESVKTIALVGVAVLAAIAAFVSARPTEYTPPDEDETGQQLFADFNDPLTAASLQIVQYDEATDTPRTFKVQKVAGRWSIPSHQNYPTDAENQLADAATSVIGLKILSKVSDDVGDHELYGLVDPDPKSGSLDVGANAIGTKVTIADSSGTMLADLIIGKAQQDRPQNRYVRRTGQNRVYLVEVSTDDLSTKFEDWIEDDLLKINTWDITQVAYDLHSVDEERGVVVDGEQLILHYDDTATDDKWTVADMSEGETLDTTLLDEMRDALDDLKIVDVARKPEALSALLRGESGAALDIQTAMSLQRHGFFIVQGQMYSNEGEVIVSMQDGVEYSLRFGEIAADSSGDLGDPDQGANRYVFISARFNPMLIPPPELEPLPGEQPAEATSTDEDATEEAADEAEEQPSQPDESGDENETSASDETTVTEDTAASDETTENDGTTEGDDAAADAGTDSPDKIDMQIERQRIEKANQRKQDEYNDKVTAGQQRAKELNSRFADWYYVISDEVYRKIRIRRSDIIKIPDASLDALKELSEQGPSGATEP